MLQKPASDCLPESVRHFDQLPDSAEVRQPTVEALFGISAATVWRWTREGRLPKPRKRGPRVTTWSVSALRAVLTAKAA